MDQFSAHLDRGWDLVQRGDAQGAEHSARRALELDGDSPEAYNLLGYAAALRGDFEDAIEHYEQAIALDETYLEAILNAAELCIYPLGDFEAAERYCEDALDLAESTEERIDALLLKFDALMGRGETVAAKHLCDRLPKDGFDNPAHAFLVARAFYEVGEVSAAAPLIEQAVQANPQSPEAHYYLGLIHDEQGRAKTALAAFLKSRQLDLETPLPPWSVSPETFFELVQGVVAALPAEYAAVLEPDQLFVAEAPGVEVVADGVDPRALLLLEPYSSPALDEVLGAPGADQPAPGNGEPSPSDPPACSEARAGVPGARLFVYQRNLERIAGTVDGVSTEFQIMLERELKAYLEESQISGASNGHGAESASLKGAEPGGVDSDGAEPDGVDSGLITPDSV